MSGVFRGCFFSLFVLRGNYGFGVLAFWRFGVRVRRVFFFGFGFVWDFGGLSTDILVSLRRRLS